MTQSRTSRNSGPTSSETLLATTRATGTCFSRSGTPTAPPAAAACRCCNPTSRRRGIRDEGRHRLPLRLERPERCSHPRARPGRGAHRTRARCLRPRARRRRRGCARLRDHRWTLDPRPVQRLGGASRLRATLSVQSQTVDPRRGVRRVARPLSGDPKPGDDGLLVGHRTDRRHLPRGDRRPVADDEQRRVDSASDA